jgi:signal transduction histidine kinase/CheY-like chemotaxis protein
MDGTDNQEPLLKLISTYAYRERKHLANRFHLGEGLVGQCALEKERILLTHVPEDYIKISSGLGEATPLNAVVLPVLFEGQVTAVIELASFHKFSDIHLSFFDQLTESIAIVLNTIAASMRTEELLKQSQSLAEELQSQQNELRETNQRLELQAQSLKTSEELLKKQQEQLQQTNDELEQRSELLANQNQEVERKNIEIELARQSLEEKAAQLALTSKYKSQFLANMSHELRTPLNSLLLLAKLFADNTENNLTPRQVEYGRTIYSAGTDLLSLINDILDLSKIESGTMSVHLSQVWFTEIASHAESNFRQLAQDKGLSFTIELDRNLPSSMCTDVKRLQQVLKNLLSNAFKFTERGEVRLRIFVARQQWSPNNERLNNAKTVIAFAIGDTGIGIAPEKQKIIFEAFQQADGTTSRKYGGTGLGLSISREIAQLLGGEIQLVSQLGQGSTFTLYLPQNSSQTDEATPETSALIQLEPEQVTTPPLQYSFTPFVTNHNNPALPGEQGKRMLLIVEDDTKFAQILLDMALQQGFNGMIAHNGSVGLSMARELMPDAIILDIRLAIMDGWTVLDRIKHDPNTRHIPVYIVSVELAQRRGLQSGALAYFHKPVNNEVLTKALTTLKGFVERQVRSLLIVAHDEAKRQSILELVGNDDVNTTAVANGADGLLALRSEHFDCLVVALPLPDMNGFELLEQIQQEVATQNLAPLPIIIYSENELTQAEETQLRQLSETGIVKNVRSPERLLNETALCLHRVSSNLTDSQRQVLERLYRTDPSLAGKKVLIVDDDIRNIFALTSILEYHQMEVLYAENGSDGIAMLQQHPDIDAVLMDVMMPGMDGYETIRTIRRISQFALLPIFALTAKAMPGDRELCLAAGASNYISKPVDIDELLSLLRVCLSE